MESLSPPDAPLEPVLPHRSWQAKEYRVQYCPQCQSTIGFKNQGVDAFFTCPGCEARYMKHQLPWRLISPPKQEAPR